MKRENHRINHRAHYQNIEHGQKDTGNMGRQLPVLFPDEKPGRTTPGKWHR